MDAKIIFRTMTPADIPTIFEIEKQSFKTPWAFNDYQECMASQKHMKIAAEMNQKILAYAVLEFSANKNVYLMKFVVAPKFRRGGLGKIFLEFLLKLIRNWGAAVYLHVNTKNIAAIRLYESCGFKVFNRLENFYKSDNENAFTMERKI